MKDSLTTLDTAMHRLFLLDAENATILKDSMTRDSLEILKANAELSSILTWENILGATLTSLSLACIVLPILSLMYLGYLMITSPQETKEFFKSVFFKVTFKQVTREDLRKKLALLNEELAIYEKHIRFSKSLSERAFIGKRMEALIREISNLSTQVSIMGVRILIKDPDYKTPKHPSPSYEKGFIDDFSS
jgi:hypothetical protein